jgi:hypothetical protein
MASRSADWVRGVARLISSTSSTLVMIGPSRKSNEPVFWLNTDTPSTSAGSRSGVHWIWVNRPPMLRDTARASTVLPTPGTSSIRQWPRQSSATSTFSTVSCLP